MDPNDKSLLLKDIDDIRSLLGALKSAAVPSTGPKRRVLHIF